MIKTDTHVFTTGTSLANLNGMEALANQISLFFGAMMAAEAERVRQIESSKVLATVLKFRTKQKEAPQKRSFLK